MLRSVTWIGQTVLWSKSHVRHCYGETIAIVRRREMLRSIVRRLIHRFISKDLIMMMKMCKISSVAIRLIAKHANMNCLIAVIIFRNLK